LTPLRPLSYREVRRKLLAAGFVETSQEGSHVKFVKVTGEGVFTAIVPQHREIRIGTLRSILRQAQIDPDQFDRL
jgi:predicted RNA binding protein YcfA (HicA-like mRNA interferase family)